MKEFFKDLLSSSEFKVSANVVFGLIILTTFIIYLFKFGPTSGLPDGLTTVMIVSLSSIGVVNGGSTIISIFKKSVSGGSIKEVATEVVTAMQESKNSETNSK